MSSVSNSSNLHIQDSIYTHVRPQVEAVEELSPKMPPIDSEKTKGKREKTRCNYDEDVLDQLQATPEGQLVLLKGVFQHNLQYDPYSRALLEKYRLDISYIQEDSLPTVKTLLAQIIFVQDWEDAPELEHVIPVITMELETAKTKQTLIKEKADLIELAEEHREENVRISEEIRLIRKEQDREHLEHLATDLAKGVQEKALATIETELSHHLEDLSARLESFAEIQDVLVLNWQITEQKTVGRYPLDAKTIFGFVSNRVKAIELGEIDLNKVQNRPVLEGLQKRYPLADGVFFERIGATQEAIQYRTRQVNTFIDYAGLTLLKNAFPAEASEEQRAEHGQRVLDHIAATRLSPL